MRDEIKLLGVMEKGYGIVPKLVMLDKDLDVVAKSFYCYLASFAGGGNEAFPSVERICGDLGISRQRLERHRKSLIEKGYITIKKFKNNGKFSHNVYILNNEVKPTLQNVTTEKPTLQKPTLQNATMENVTTNNNIFNNNIINNNNINKDNMSSKLDHAIPYKTIVDYLNEKTNSKFKHTTSSTISLIKARFKDGYNTEDFKIVIDKKTKEWLNNPDMNQYLRPNTLFGTKFESYLNQKEKVYQTKQQYNQQPRTTYENNIIQPKDTELREQLRKML